MITDIKIPSKICENNDLSFLKLNIITADKIVNKPYKKGVLANFIK